MKLSEMTEEKLQEYNQKKDKFVKLLQSRGYKNIHRFAIACGVEGANVYSNLNGTFDLSMQRAFVYANKLGVPLMDVVNLFYPQWEEENRSAIEERDMLIG